MTDDKQEQNPAPEISPEDKATARLLLGPSRSRGWDQATRDEVAKRLRALRALKLWKVE